MRFPISTFLAAAAIIVLLFVFLPPPAQASDASIAGGGNNAGDVQGVTGRQVGELKDQIMEDRLSCGAGGPSAAWPLALGLFAVVAVRVRRSRGAA